MAARSEPSVPPSSRGADQRWRQGVAAGDGCLQPLEIAGSLIRVAAWRVGCRGWLFVQPPTCWQRTSAWGLPVSVRSAAASASGQPMGGRAWGETLGGAVRAPAVSCRAENEGPTRESRPKVAKARRADGPTAGGSSLTRWLRVRTGLRRGDGARAGHVGLSRHSELLIRSNSRNRRGFRDGLRGVLRSVRWPADAHLPRTGRGEQVYGADAEDGGETGQRSKGQVLLTDLHPSNVDA